MLFNVRENDNTDFATLTTPAFKFQRYGTDLVTILRNGNVGIGSTDPTGKLEAAGAIRSNSNSIITAMSNTGSQGVVGTISNHDLRLYTNNTAQMTIMANGN